MYKARRHLTQPAERLSISGKAIHDHAKGQRLQRSDDTHGGEGHHADSDLSLGPRDVRKQFFEVLPTGGRFRGGWFRRVRSEYGGTGSAANLHSAMGAASHSHMLLQLQSTPMARIKNTPRILSLTLRTLRFGTARGGKSNFNHSAGLELAINSHRLRHVGPDTGKIKLQHFKIRIVAYYGFAGVWFSVKFHNTIA